jgi:hypothetical protein
MGNNDEPHQHRRSPEAETNCGRAGNTAMSQGNPIARLLVFPPVQSATASIEPEVADPFVARARKPK